MTSTTASVYPARSNPACAFRPFPRAQLSSPRLGISVLLRDRNADGREGSAKYLRAHRDRDRSLPVRSVRGELKTRAPRYRTETVRDSERISIRPVVPD